MATSAQQLLAIAKADYPADLKLRHIATVLERIAKEAPPDDLQWSDLRDRIAVAKAVPQYSRPHIRVLAAVVKWLRDYDIPGALELPRVLDPYGHELAGGKHPEFFTDSVPKLVECLERANGLPAEEASMPEQQAKLKPVKKRPTSEEVDIACTGYITEHHRARDGDIKTLEPVVLNAMAKKLGISTGAISNWFLRNFGDNVRPGTGKANYEKACSDKQTLKIALKSLNGEYRPSELFKNARLPD